MHCTSSHNTCKENLYAVMNGTHGKSVRFTREAYYPGVPGVGQAALPCGSSNRTVLYCLFAFLWYTIE
jgi:hypothetical protein